MLCFITTDADISSALLERCVKDVAGETFNMVVGDGDTSTNDMLTIMASGLCGNEKITEKNDDYAAFYSALLYVCTQLSVMIARDGEGATKLIICNVNGAPALDTARTAAKSVISSSLVKTAMFGSDANWGRVMCALGYAECDLDVSRISVRFGSDKGSILVCENGTGVPFSEEKAKEILLRGEVSIDIDLNDGKYNATAYGCDLSYDYVKINGDYRS
jgi:glutamate N-acetyltransferase/amino-acid N-acetyltransferase